MKIEIIQSRDGSHTLFRPDLNETYHSLHGAIQESQYVFIEKGLKEAVKEWEEITILEIGFGTGLNALLALMFSEEQKIKITYHTLEPYPLSEEVYKNLNYLQLLNVPQLQKEFYQMHEVADGEKCGISDTFTFFRHLTTLEQFKEPLLKSHVIFFDAFAPSKQPEVWALSNLQRIRKFMHAKGIFVTYCAMGQFKRDLKEVGFEVETLPGPPGKKEMTRGILL